MRPAPNSQKEIADLEASLSGNPATTTLLRYLHPLKLCCLIEFFYDRQVR